MMVHQPRQSHLLLAPYVRRYDSNGVTLDKMAEHTQSEDVQMRFEAQGWEVLTVDGHDMDALTKAYRYAKESDNGARPRPRSARELQGSA